MAKNEASTALAASTSSPAIATETAGATTSPTQHLIVIHPFGNYAKGARIEDANEIATVLAGENAASCNRINVGA